MSRRLAVLVVAGALGVMGLAGLRAPASADPGHQFSIADATVTEGTGSTVNAQVIITVAPPVSSGEVLTVDWATSDAAPGTATPGDDYTESSAKETFTAGQAQHTISVPIVSDNVDEPNETFLINLINPQSTQCTSPCAISTASIAPGQGQATVTITDDDVVTLAINNVTVTEGNTGISPPTPATFTVTKTGATSRDVTVNFGTANDTAVAPGDYVTQTGTLVFAPGDTTKSITVNVVGDTADEADTERFFVNLSGASNATVTDPQGDGTITDDDALPTLAINDVTVAEGNLLTEATFIVTKTGATARTVTVNFATRNGTATAGADYISQSGTLSFAPGDTEEEITVQVAGDTADEANETFFVDLSGATNATISKTVGVGTITDDDAGPTLAINDRTVNEGNSGTTTATFTVTLTGSTNQTVTVDFATADGTAFAPADYLSNSGTKTFVPGDTSETIDIQVVGDTVAEGNETFFVNLFNAQNATISDAQGIGTITDDERRVNINDASAEEGNPVTFTVTLSSPPDLGQSATVNYATADETAVAPGDYTAQTGSIVFTAGETQEQITITTIEDSVGESNETFLVNLSKPASCCTGIDYFIQDGTGQGTITNDDTALAINDVTVTEGNSGTVAATFTVTRSGPNLQTSTVDFATANDTAVAPGDYVASSGTLTFVPGDTEESITVNVAGDTVDEADETFFVNLSNATNATITDGQGVGTITDDDGATGVTLAINDVTVTEGDVGTTAATFNVTKSGATGQTVTVDFATANGTAVAPGDYLSNSGTLTFAPADNQESITVNVVGDTTDESNETFDVNLSNATNATISDNKGIGTITDDDGPPPPPPGAAGLRDFNGDGFDDAAFGAPDENIGSSSNGGVVNVIYGSASGLSATTPLPDRVWGLDDFSPGVASDDNDRFGSALAIGNFNGDGFADLAVGIPGRLGKAGAVSVIYGSASGLTATDSQFWQQGTGGLLGALESNDAFGASLTAGDFDGDGISDLAIGAPDEKIGSEAKAGAVSVLYGSGDGLTADDDQLFHQDFAGMPGTPATRNDRLGHALTAGDMNGDGRDDLAVGVPGEDVAGRNDAGAVDVLYGSATGLTVTGSQQWHQNSAGSEDPADANDRFGWSLASGDFDGDLIADLAVGVPLEDVSGKKNAGGVNVLYGSSPSGLAATGSQFWSQDSGVVLGAAEPSDALGWAVNAGDFNGDGFADLAAGARGEGVSGKSKAGAVNVLYGSVAGLSDTGNQLWHQDVAGVVADGVDKNDFFGYALSSGDFDGDQTSDLIIGVPLEDIDGLSNAGAANVVYGSGGGLTTTGDQFWHQDSGNVDGAAEGGDQFGKAVA